MVETDWETAEMIKYANNSFLATKISFINEIANICDLIGADVKTVSRAIGMDYRIGPKFLNAGVGYGGSCFPKDIKAIIQVAGGRGYEAKLLKEVHELNERQKKIMIRKIRDHFGGRIKGTTLSLWGLSFKPKTSDIRDAASLQMIAELLKEGARINVYDPAAMEEVKKIFGDQINYFNSVAGSAENSSGLIVVTEWDEFRNIDLKEIGEKMKEKILFDGRNVYNPEEAREQGFKYYGVGRG
jgi:UDPglucose 6-dehydrogenase